MNGALGSWSGSWPPKVRKTGNFSRPGLTRREKSWPRSAPKRQWRGISPAIALRRRGLTPACPAPNTRVEIDERWKDYFASGHADRLDHQPQRRVGRNLPRAPWRGPAGSTQPPGDAGLVQIVGGHLHLHAVAGGQADEALAHLAGNGGQHLVLVVEFHPEHRACQHGDDAAFYFNVLFHQFFTTRARLGSSRNSTGPPKGAPFGRQRSPAALNPPGVLKVLRV